MCGRLHLQMLTDLHSIIDKTQTRHYPNTLCRVGQLFAAVCLLLLDLSQSHVTCVLNIPPVVCISAPK
jgi:hypothetical protein